MSDVASHLAFLRDPRLAAQATSATPVWLWSTDATRILWANPVGAAIFGVSTSAELAARRFGARDQTATQIERLLGTLRLGGAARLERLRGFGSGFWRALMCTCSRITLPDHTPGILVVAMEPAGPALPLAERLRRLYDGTGVAIATFTPDGKLVHATAEGRARLGGAATLEALGAERIADNAIALGRVAGEIPFGRVTIERLGVDATTVVAMTFAAERVGAPAPAEPPPAQMPPPAPPIEPPIAHEDPASPEPQAPAPAEPAPPEIVAPPTVPAEPAVTDAPPVVPDADVSQRAEHGMHPAPVDHIPVPPLRIDMPIPERRHPLRFVWQMDASGRFTLGSDEFTEVIGPSVAIALGRPWTEVNEELALDPEGQVARAVATRDTWSGITVSWPVDGSADRLKVELSGLPIYDRNRNFLGYRGFGVCRDIDRIATLAMMRRSSLVGGTANSAAGASAAAEPVAPAPAEPAPAAGPEARPALSLVPSSANVVPFRSSAAEPRTPGLSPVERNAFHELARKLTARLKGEADGQAADPAPDAAEAAPAEGGLAEEARPDLAETASDIMPAAAEPVASVAPAAVPATEQAEPPPPAETEVTAGPEVTSESEATAGAAATAHAAATAEHAQAASAASAEARADTAALVHAEALADTAQSPPSVAVTEHQVREPLERPVLDRLPVGILVYRLDTLLYANRAFLDWTGYEHLDALAEAGGLDSLFVEGGGHGLGEPEPGAPVLGEPGGAGKSLTIATPRGDRLPVEGRLLSLPWDGESALVLVLLNAAADERRKATETALRLAETHARELKAVLDTATDGVVVIEPDGRIVSTNRGAEALFGYEASELASRSFVDLFAAESRPVVLEYLASLMRGGIGGLLNDGREVSGQVRQGGAIALFMTLGRITDESARVCAVFRDISPWKKAESELTAARQAAEQASAAKSDFLAKISHEIRTPLNSIVGFSEVMLEERFGPIGNERYRDYLKDIRNSGDHLVSLLNDLLDLSKIEAGRLDLSFADLNLNEVVQSCVALMQPQANRERIIIRTSLSPTLRPVVADARSVRQIVLNLLSNSIKFTGAGGQVIVSTALSGSGAVVLRVRDTGIGMDDKELAVALEPFRQLATATRWGSAGTGLGLPLTKALTEANRAQFAITSKLNDGTLVEVAFPATRVLAE
jgi:PAS domain S-box-containing protein